MKIRLNHAGAELYFKCMWLLTVGLYILIPLEHSVLKYLYNGIHLVTVVIFVIMTMVSIHRGTLDGFNVKRLALLIATTITVFSSALLTNEKITFSVHITGILGFLEMLLAIYIVDRVSYSESTLAFLFRTNLVIALVFIALFFTPFAYSSRLIDSLNLGYANPNATAIYLFMNVSVLFLYSTRIQRITSRLAVYAICAFLTFLIYETDSRACLLAVLLVVAYLLIAPKIKIPKVLIPVILLVPLAFLFFYIAMYRSGKYAELTILGKPFFSGRERFFAQMLDSLKDYWLVGDVGQHPFENMHNGPLTLLSGCGVVGYIFYLWYINSTISHYYRGKVTQTQTVALIVICTAFIHSGAEAALVVGGANYSITMATFYWLLKGSRCISEEGGQGK